MEWTQAISALTWEDIQGWLKQYEALGPIPGILAPLVESFFPVLPLVAILIANVNAYGLGEGVLLSWIGVVGGASCVFAVVRTFGGRLRGLLERKLPRTGQLIHWLEKHGFSSVFLLACFPFTPSAVVTVVSALSRMPFHTFFTATALGKGVMIFLVSLAGNDLADVLKQPWKIALILGVFGLLWLLGKKVESKYMK
ncbi:MULTISPECIES: TVP38/TMEM64 family protein [unclassified Paenibacillus]|uniref:TVP38/TMEM64 family protein n=1 Tax=unclassified Paenibacillus TaxID=185978 RepID=UPI001915E0F6|nr:TVP38/TMEM64 family protein [Paenibacillus sp. EPM92]